MVMGVNSQRSQDRILTQRNELHRVTSKEKKRRNKLKGPKDKIAKERNKVTKETKQSTGRTFIKRQGGWHAPKIRNQHSWWVLTLVDSSLRSLRRQATGVRRHVVPTRAPFAMTSCQGSVRGRRYNRTKTLCGPKRNTFRPKWTVFNKRPPAFLKNRFNSQKHHPRTRNS